MDINNLKYFFFAVSVGIGSLGYAETKTTYGGVDEHAPEITVQAISKVVNAGDLTRDGMEATFEFWVEAETDRINLTCLVSDLNLASAVGSSTGAQVDLSRGCRIEVIDGYSVAGKNWEIVSFKNEKHKIDGNLSAIKSDYVTFRTIDATNFRRNVYITLSWQRSSGSKPVGSYEGSVKLVAEVPDNIHPPK